MLTSKAYTTAAADLFTECAVFSLQMLMSVMKGSTEQQRSINEKKEQGKKTERRDKEQLLMQAPAQSPKHEKIAWCAIEIFSNQCLQSYDVSY